jgi:hypothetical protein
MGEKEREWVAALYPAPKWKTRVKRMSDDQIIAIYLRAKSAQPKPKPSKESNPNGQDTLF